MEMFWILAALFITITFAFVAMAFLFPEMVGITGKVSKDIERHQRGDENKDEKN